MAKKDAIDNELDLITNEDIEQISDLQQALDIINKEQVIPEAKALVKKDCLFLFMQMLMVMVQNG